MRENFKKQHAHNLVHRLKAIWAHVHFAHIPGTFNQARASLIHHTHNTLISIKWNTPIIVCKKKRQFCLNRFAAPPSVKRARNTQWQCGWFLFIYFWCMDRVAHNTYVYLQSSPVFFICIWWIAGITKNINQKSRGSALMVLYCVPAVLPSATHPPYCGTPPCHFRPNTDSQPISAL